MPPRPEPAPDIATDALTPNPVFSFFADLDMRFAV
jgi:hypothetical protein